MNFNNSEKRRLTKYDYFKMTLKFDIKL
nr:hypothetical protein [Streptococcus mitis]